MLGFSLILPEVIKGGSVVEQKVVLIITYLEIDLSIVQNSTFSGKIHELKYLLRFVDLFPKKSTHLLMCNISTHYLFSICINGLQ